MSDSSALVSFVPPANNGGSAIEYYIVAVYSINGVVVYPSTSKVLNFTGASSPITVTGLVNGTEYTFVVEAVNAFGISPPSSPSNVVTPSGLPAAPTIGTAVYNGTLNNVSVAFVPPVVTGGLPVIGYKAVSSPDGAVVLGTASPLIFSNPTLGSSYTYTVAAENSNGYGPFSLPSNSITPASVPAAPTIGVATYTPSTAILSVAFQPSVSNGGSPITSYTAVASPGGATSSSGGSPINFTGLTVGTTYTFVVYATNAVGNSVNSAASNGATPVSAPSQCTGLVAVPGDGKATITFNAPVSNGGLGISQYQATSTPGGFTGSAAVFGPIVVTGLTDGVSYTFTVVAINQLGAGPISPPSNAVTPGAVASAPTIGTATGINTTAFVATGSATVTFTPPGTTTGITSYLATSSPGGLTGSVAAGAGTTITVNGLTFGTSYTFTVQSINAYGPSAASAASNAVTSLGVPTITGTPVVSAGNGQITVSSYTAPTSNGGTAVTGYKALVTPGGATMTVTGATPSPIIIPGLTNGVAYTVQVRASNSIGVGPYSLASASVTPASSVSLPSAPGPMFVTGQTTNTMSIKWSAATQGAYPVASYNIYRNGSFYTSGVTNLYYTDSNALNCTNPLYGGGDPDPTSTVPGNVYSYTVSAVDSQGNEGPQQTLMTYIAYYNGTWAWGHDYNYNCTSTYNDTTGGPLGGTADVKTVVTAAYGQWQPYSGGNVTQWSLNIGMMQSMTLWLKPTVANQDWRTDIVTRLPGGDAFPYKNVYLSAYGTITQNQWTKFVIPLADLNMGFTTFVGGVAPTGTTTPIPLETGTVNWYTATLTCTSTTLGPGIDVGGYVTGSTMPAGTFILTHNQNSSIGTFVICGPNLTSSTTIANGTTLYCQRTEVEKVSLIDETGLSSNTYYQDNLTFYGTQGTGSGGGSKAGLLAYLNTISGQTLVGQHVQLFNGNGTATALTQWNALVSATGKTPAIMGTLLNTTYILGLGTVGIDGPTNAALFQQQTGAGGLIHLSWYTPNPVTNASNSSSGNNTLSASNFTKVITPGNSVYNNYQNYMASAVATLTAAPYANVPCLFRPFIEFSSTAEGVDGTNWYSNQNSADFITFWKMTYNYFVNAGVTWLLWVWNLNDYPTVPNGTYYPGDAYVDIVSSDTYPNPGNSTQMQSDINFNWSTLQSYSKLKIFSEVGYNGSGSNDNEVWLNTISTYFSQAIGYVVWDAQYAIVNGANASSLMNDSRSITLDKLPPGLV